MSNPLPLIVANFKANKSWNEVSAWIDQVGPVSLQFKGTIVLCPAFPFLASAAQIIEKNSYEIKLGAQEISKFNQGAYTGEVAASQIKSICQFSIIGHSERHKYFGEKEKEISQKAQNLLENQIIPILCISNLNQLDLYLKENFIQENWQDLIFVYEPPEAISGGGNYKPEDPQTAEDNAAKISEIVGQKITVLYGGSINPQNAKSFMEKENIDGGLIGQASLDPQSFTEILKSIK